MSVHIRIKRENEDPVEMTGERVVVVTNDTDPWSFHTHHYGPPNDNRRVEGSLALMIAVAMLRYAQHFGPMKASRTATAMISAYDRAAT